LPNFKKFLYIFWILSIFWLSTCHWHLPIWGCLFILLNVSFIMQKHFTLDFCAFGTCSEKSHWSYQYLEIFLLFSFGISRAYIKIFDPLWVEFWIEWETGIKFQPCARNTSLPTPLQRVSWL
jgi:hypothetical protein